MPTVPRELDADTYLRPYRFHGLDIRLVSNVEANAECPFCGRTKFYVSVLDGRWTCHSGECQGESGNALSFLRKLYSVSVSNTRIHDLEELARQRHPLRPESLAAWGVCRSVIDRSTWLAPGYNASGKIIQVYRWSQISDNKKTRMAFLPTPCMGEENDGYGHGYFRSGWDSKKRRAWVVEGLWNGIALWEGLKDVREGWGGEYEPAMSEAGSLLSESNILAMPTAHVFFKSWARLLEGKDVVLFPDNDRPKVSKLTGRTSQPGLDGMKKVVSRLMLEVEHKRDRMRYIDWSAYSKPLKDGYDCRDWMGETGTSQERMKELSKLIKTVPKSWTEVVAMGGVSGVSPTSCSTWSEVTTGWKNALYWRDSLDYALSIMMAVALSTDQSGDQLFLRVVASAGSAKSKLADAMLVSKHCYALEHLKGFHSGWRDPSGEDFSLIARINHKTLITSEADVLISSPYFQEIMSQQRRIFDGTTGASYKNLKKDRRYTGLRTPWILCGTPAILDTDQSRLGDRFLTVCIDDPGIDERRGILQKVGLSALHSVRQIANGQPESSLEEKMAVAYRLTGGYIDHLRQNSQSIINPIVDRLLIDSNGVLDRCAQLAEFTALYRVQIHPIKDLEVSVELPTRLTHQYTRLACCIAAVLNKDSVDNEVMGRVKQIAIDTARGYTLKLSEMLYIGERVGFTDESLRIEVDRDTKFLNRQLRMMRTVGLAEYYQTRNNGSLTRPKWRLTQRAYNLLKSTKEN